MNVDVTITGKQLVPSVFNVKQGSNLSDSLKLNFDSYASESGVDLSKCNCTVICELKASKPMPFEIIKLNPVKNSDGTMTVTWDIDNRVTCYYGNVLFEIVFKDGSGNIAWVSHTAVLIVGKSSSSTADEDTIARYPSILELLIEQTSQGGIDDFNVVTTGSGPFVESVEKDGDTVTVNKSGYRLFETSSGPYVTGLLISSGVIVQKNQIPQKISGTFRVTYTSGSAPAIFHGEVDLSDYLSEKLILINIYNKNRELIKQVYALSNFSESSASVTMVCSEGVISITAYGTTTTEHTGYWSYEILYIE